MASILDIVLSSLFGGVLLLVIVTASDIASESQSVANGDMLVQEMLTTTAQMVEGEFRNMGFGVPETDRTILVADSTHIKFLSKLDRNPGNPDTIDYATGNPNQLLGTPNELDRFLTRKINSEPALRVGVVTVFNLQYYTRVGDTLATPVPGDRLSEIHVVQVTMEVQNPYALLRHADQVKAGERTALYSSSLWQQTRLASQNSRR